jgi:hypothetical protein
MITDPTNTTSLHKHIRNTVSARHDHGSYNTTTTESTRCQQAPPVCTEAYHTVRALLLVCVWLLHVEVDVIHLSSPSHRCRHQRPTLLCRLVKKLAPWHWRGQGAELCERHLRLGLATAQRSITSCPPAAAVDTPPRTMRMCMPTTG